MKSLEKHPCTINKGFDHQKVTGPGAKAFLKIIKPFIFSLQMEP